MVRFTCPPAGVPSRRAFQGRPALDIPSLTLTGAASGCSMLNRINSHNFKFGAGLYLRF